MYNKKESTEDYLESIYLAKKEYSKLRSIDLATFMHFSKASVSIALKKLVEKEYVIISSNGIIDLTIKGEQLAKETYDKHVILTNWITSLGVDKEIAEADACKIEHLLSDETYLAIKKMHNH